MGSNCLRICGVICLLLVMIIPSTSSAVSYLPPFRLATDSGSSVVKGGNVYLFHSATPDVMQAIHPGEVLVVYRITASCKMEEVGKVRFVKFVGEIYLEAEVIEGELKAGDIAKAKNASCLIIATEPCDR